MFRWLVLGIFAATGVSAWPASPDLSITWVPPDAFLVVTNLDPGVLYDIESSTNLAAWTRARTFRPREFTYSTGNVVLEGETSRFFRARRVSPLNDDFANRFKLTGSNITTNGTIRGANRESWEPIHFFEINQTVWYSWTAPAHGHVYYWVHTDFADGTHNFYPYLAVYTGTFLDALTLVKKSDNNNIQFNTTAGTEYQFMVEGYAPDDSSRGDFIARIAFSIPPQVTLLTPAAGTHYTAPANVTVSATASDPDGTIQSVVFFTEGNVFSITLTNAPFVATFTNLPAGFFNIRAKATDDFDVSTTTDSVLIQISPSNDNFANRIAITGTNLLVRGRNSAATREPGEPLHAGVGGEHSVWWTWMAPVTGLVTLTTLPTGVDTLLGVYTGDKLAELTSVVTGGDGRTSVALNALAGTVYQIAVDSYPNPLPSTGAIRVNLTLE